MLTALRLGNFKAFADIQRIPIRPLTLIFGANSSGKSSLIHGLLLARHAIETGELDVHRTTIGGESVDLGGFRQYIHRREANRRIEWAVELDVARLQGRVAELLAPIHQACISLRIGIDLDDQERPLPGAIPTVMSYEIEADGASLLRMSRRPGGNLRLDRLEHKHPALWQVIKATVETTTTTESLTTADFEGVEEVITELVPEFTIQAGKLLPYGLLRPEKSLGESGQEMLIPISRERRREDLTAAVRLFMPRILNEIIQGLNETISTDLSRLRYLGPLRSYPPRHLAFTQHHDPNWFAGGGYAWDVVRRDEEIRGAVNAWLGSPDRLQTPYELVVRRLISPEDAYNELWEGIEDMYKELTEPERISPEEAKEMGLIDSGTTVREIREEYSAEIEQLGKDPLSGWDPDTFVRLLTKRLLDEGRLEGLNELVLVDKRSNTVVSHRDVGIGVSQVLPVLVGAYASQNQIITIEQPEIHLHPALQAELGDVFIESALSEKQNTFIIETHSEHLILRILKRIRQTTGGKNEITPPIKPEHVAILFIGSTQTGSTVQELRIDERGRLIDPCPGGFFEEGFEELF